MNSHQTRFALIDGNTFYASCEIAFQPHLEKRPVVVLSNNDGCIVAANQLAKDLNAEIIQSIQSFGTGGYYSAQPSSMMFQPYYKVKAFLDKHNTAVFSSNYELYADMSNRMHRIVGRFAPHQQIYSIDESFLDLTSLGDINLTHYAQQIKSTVKQFIGIPVAIGIGQTKTLAKLANHLAKKHPQHQGVLDISEFDEVTLNMLFSQIEIGKIWGIGKHLETRLKQDGILSVKDLKQANPQRIRKAYGVMVERTLRELNGQSCLNTKDIHNHKQQIISSRSFGLPVTDYKSLEQAVITYTSLAAEKLRHQEATCQMISVYISTNRFKKLQEQYKNTKTISLIYPTDNTILLAKMAKRALQKIWIEGYKYNKAGVVLSEIEPKRAFQEDIFAPNPTYSGNTKQAKLMDVMDKINKKNGKNTLFLGSTGTDQPWKMKRSLMSPRYTTHWDELLTVSG